MCILWRTSRALPHSYCAPCPLLFIGRSLSRADYGSSWDSRWTFMPWRRIHRPTACPRPWSEKASTPPLREGSAHLPLEPYFDPAIRINNGWRHVGVLEELVQPGLTFVHLPLLKSDSLASPRLPEFLAGGSGDEGINDWDVHAVLQRGHFGI